MHNSVMEFLAVSLTAEEVCGKSVLEVGSLNVNGSPRQVILPHKPLVYEGIDMMAGDGVDVVLDATDLWKHVMPVSRDVLICCEMLEHAENWRHCIQQMKLVLRVNGVLVLTTRSPGFPLHGYPDDFWRFRPKDFREIFSDMQIEYLTPDPQPGHPGVFVKARKMMSGRFDLSHVKPASMKVSS